jgi:hypothetical protein
VREETQIVRGRACVGERCTPVSVSWPNWLPWQILTVLLAADQTPVVVAVSTLPTTPEPFVYTQTAKRTGFPGEGMDRRDFIGKMASTAVALAACSATANGRAGDERVCEVIVDAARKVGSIPADFMGLGYEISSVARPGLLSPRNRTYVQLVQGLGRQGVIRVGGNTADYAHYSSNAATVSSPDGTVVNDAVLRDLGGFLKETGWRLLWALNAGNGSEAEAIAEARTVTAAAGERLLAFEIGNEPDLFSGEKHRPPGYGYEEWLQDYRRFKTALRAQIPDIRFAGPDVAGKTEWVTRFAAEEGKDAALLTHHYYREGQNPTSTIDKLLGIDPKLQPQLEQLRTASQKCGVPYRICEVNSFSGGGRPGVSDTMAGALWVLDYLFTLAYNGCSGVNMETGMNQHAFISSYSPIGDDEHGHHAAKPEYYGLLAFAMFGHGALLDVRVSADSPTLKAYATTPTENTLLVTLINKGGTEAAVNVAIGSEVNGFANTIRLTGPAVNATTGITLGGSEVSSSGTWKLARPEALPMRKGRSLIRMPAYSAAIVEMARGLEFQGLSSKD